MEKAVTSKAADTRTRDKLFWGLLAAGLLLFAVVTIPPGAREAAFARENLVRVQTVSQELATTEGILRDRERSLQTDPFANEAVLRSRMKYTKPGEREVPVEQTQDRRLLVESPKPATYVPLPMQPAGVAGRVTNWALLAASALLVAGAFIFFDRPR